VARECGLPFLSVKGPELLGSYVGESEANVRAVFAAARRAAAEPPAPALSLDDGQEGDGAGSNGPRLYTGASVLFFDELDSLAPRRGDSGHGDGVMDRVVATLLGELDDDGAGGAARVIVIGATNRPDLLDPSLLRPGRFDRRLYLGPARTREHCLQILLAQTRKFRFREEGGGEEGTDDAGARFCASTGAAARVLSRALEAFPPGLSGADLSAVASGALMRGLRRVCEGIEMEARATAVDIEDVMESWSAERLRPAMTMQDFVQAAQEVVPSISKQELAKFEQSKANFC
jgi:peroxin-6